MSRPGTEVLREIDRHLERVRGELDRTQEDYAHTEERLREFVGRRGEAILELAEHYLPRVDRATVEATFDGLKENLAAVLARKERRDQGLRDDLTRQTAELRTLEEERDGIDTELAEIAGDRERIEREIAAGLAADPLFQETSKLAVHAEERLHRNEQRLEEVREDAARKLPSYDESRLYRYLYDRGFGRPAYTASGFTKRMDGWVARLIDFPALRHGFEFLKKTPALMEAEITRRREDFEQLMERLERMEAEAVATSGRPELDARVEELNGRRTRVEREIESRTNRVERAAEAVESVEHEDDRFYREALERVRRFLEEARAQVLEEHAAATPEPRDDQLVKDITWLSTEIDGLRPEMERRTGERDEARRRTKGLEFLSKRFRQSMLDSEKSIFPVTYDVGKAVDRFLVGAVDQRELWEQVRSEHDTEHGELENLATSIGQSSPGGAMWRAMTELTAAAAGEALRRGMRRRGGR